MAEKSHGVVSHRDPDVMRARLGQWLGGHLSHPEITSFTTPEANGQSSETILFDVDHAAGHDRLVARVAPDDGDLPVFERYDLELQFRVMELVAARSDAPVPRVRWLETDESVVGAPFFVMDRVDGRVPPDLMPYTFGSWLTEATPAEQQGLQDDTVWTIAGIHEADLIDVDVSFLGSTDRAVSTLRSHVEETRSYYEWIRNGRTIPVVEAGFRWVDDHWPVGDGGPPVLNWGDARIGNMLYDGFRPAAVLDWEMACLAPRGVDDGWCVYIHEFFQDIAEQMGLPGLPDFMRVDDVVATYALRTGVDLGDLRFWRVYAALRYGLIMCRVHDRRVAFGEDKPSTTPDGPVMNAPQLYRMLDA